MKRILIAMACLALSSPAAAQQCYPYCPPTYPNFPVARAPIVKGPSGNLEPWKLYDAIVQVKAGTMVSSRCTGTVIGQDKEHSYVVTCWHLLRDGERPIYVRTNEGRNYEAEIVKMNPVNDFLLLRCPNTGIAPVKYSEDTDAVKQNDDVTMYGFSASHGFVRTTGKVVKFVSFGSGDVAMETTCGTSEGMSGGPIIVNGCVVGVITGSDGRGAVGPCFPRLRMAIRRLLPPYRRPQQIVVVQPPAQFPTPPAQDQGLPEQPKEPTPADPSQEPGQDDLMVSLDEIVARMDERLVRVENMLEQLETEQQPGPQGEPGAQGPQGPQGPQGEKGDPFEPTDEFVQRIASSVAAALKADETFANSLKPEMPEIDIEGLNDAAVANFASQVWLYYTSASAPQLVEVDEKIQALREQGYPIIVTYLTPQQATVMGVPMIFVPSTNKKVVGISNCTQFLARQIPR